MTFEDPSDLPDDIREEATAQSGVSAAAFNFLESLYGGDWVGTWDAMHPTLRLCVSQFWANRNRQSLQTSGHSYETTVEELSTTSQGEHELWEPFTSFLSNALRGGTDLDPTVAGIGHSARPVALDIELLYVHPEGGVIWQPGEVRGVYPLLMQLDEEDWKVLNWRSETIPVPGYPPALN